MHPGQKLSDPHRHVRLAAGLPRTSGWPKRPGGDFFSCACCGRRLRDDQVAASTETRLMRLDWCGPCHAGQHWLNFGSAAGEVKP
jgi:hypothetical protein